MIVGVDKVADKTFDYVVIGMFVLPLLELLGHSRCSAGGGVRFKPSIAYDCLTKLGYSRRRD